MSHNNSGYQPKCPNSYRDGELHLPEQGSRAGLTIKNKYQQMKTLTLNIPDNLDLDNRELVMLLASKLYEQGKLSLGQAAEFAGLTKRAFAELLNRYNVSIFNFPSSDLSSDVSNA